MILQMMELSKFVDPGVVKHTAVVFEGVGQCKSEGTLELVAHHL